MADAYFFLFFLLPLLLLVILYFLVKPRPVKIPIKNRHVFITGGSSGIGLALAHRAAAEGARVSILARSLGKLEEARNAIRLATGIEVAVFAADVRDFEAVKRAVDEAGPIDVLLLNHGVFVALELEKMELSEIKFTMDVNLMGTLNLIKAALPVMKNRKDPLPASIALVSSQAGQVNLHLFALSVIYYLMIYYVNYYCWVYTFELLIWLYYIYTHFIGFSLYNYELIIILLVYTPFSSIWPLLILKIVHIKLIKKLSAGAKTS